jgi:hypothetical protein
MIGCIRIYGREQKYSSWSSACFAKPPNQRATLFSSKDEPVPRSWNEDGRVCVCGAYVFLVDDMTNVLPQQRLCFSWEVVKGTGSR